jgi:hypothetical protein
MKKSTIVALVAVVVVVAAAGWYYMSQKPVEQVIAPGTNEPQVVAPATSTPAVPENKEQTVIGKSVEGRDIVAYHFGTGDKEVLLIGGIHGGYSWNTSLVAYEAMDYFKANSNAIPAGVKVTVIPVLNPDGLNKVADASTRFAAADVTASQAVQISGRYNANNVDLNRNFDCDWQPTGKWQSVTVSGGTAAFSEPESLAIKNYVESQKPVAVVAWYSSAGGVFSSNCHDGVLAETTVLNNLYAKASGYPGHNSFDFYSITGDMMNWLAKSNIPAISVLLTNHTDTDWSKNRAGIDAVLKNYAD